MSDLGPLQRPIITGQPAAATQTKPVRGPAAAESGQNFNELLRQTMAAQTTTSRPLTLSKHAQLRAEQREIPLTGADFERLDQAVELARDKGLTDTLVMMDDTAFIVNVPNRVVITMLEGSSEADGKVFSNIDGAVII